MRFADFFAGIGLAEMGLERAGWQCLFANDNDSRKREMYAANFDASRYLLKDVHEVRGDEVPEVDLASASFPCTDLSLAGERQGLNGKESGALWGFLRVLDQMRHLGKARSGRRLPGLVLLARMPRPSADAGVSRRILAAENPAQQGAGREDEGRLQTERLEGRAAMGTPTEGRFRPMRSED